MLRALIASLLLLPLAAGAADMEHRCEVLGSVCKLSEPLNIGTAHKDPTCNGGGVRDWDWDNNEGGGTCSYYNMDDSVMKGCQQNAPCEMTCTSTPGMLPVAASGFSSILPANNTLSWLMRHKGNAICHISHPDIAFDQSTGTTACMRVYRQWDATYLPQAPHDEVDVTGTVVDADVDDCGNEGKAPCEYGYTSNGTINQSTCEVGTTRDAHVGGGPCTNHCDNNGGRDECGKNCFDDDGDGHKDKGWCNGFGEFGCTNPAGCCPTNGGDEGCEEPQQKILTWGGYTSGHLNDIAWLLRTQFSMYAADNGDKGRIAWSSDWTNMGIAHQGGPFVMGNIGGSGPDICTNNLCRFEICIVYEKDGDVKIRSQFENVSPGTGGTQSFNEASVGSFSGNFSLVNGTNAGDMFFTQHTPSIVTRSSHYMIAVWPSDAADLWIGPASEVEGSTAPASITYSSGRSMTSEFFPYTWKPLKVGGGGWLVGIDISNDGLTKVVRTDTYGAYLLNGSVWSQLLTEDSMPAGFADSNLEGMGVYEIKVAPSNSNILYMAWQGYVFKSTNRGTTWTQTGFAQQLPMDPNDDYRMYGEKMAVDPTNPNIVYVGTQEDGLWYTQNGGTSWTQESEVPAGTGVGINGIFFDNVNGDIYAARGGTGVYRSVDDGANWALMSGSPTHIRHLAAKNGIVYATNTLSQFDFDAWKYNGSSWTQLDNTQNWHTVLIDPNDSNRIVLGGDGGALTVSHDAGAHWDNYIFNVARASPDVPWLSYTTEGYMSNGEMLFDPQVPGKIWFSEGIGVWNATLSPIAQTSITWTSITSGIEQLVGNSIASAPTSGVTVLASWDRPLFTITNPDTYQSTHGPNSSFGHSVKVGVTSSVPTTFFSLNDIRVGVGDELEPNGAISSDGGSTWNLFATAPLGSVDSDATWGHGTGAASTPAKVVWIPSNGRRPYYTTDTGATWNAITLPGVADDGTSAGWGGVYPTFPQIPNHHSIDADKVTANTYYLIHKSVGVFKSSDSGATWTNVHAGDLLPAINPILSQLSAVPGHAGHLFYTAGHVGGGEAGEFLHSTDGGATWNAIADVLEVHAFGFGRVVGSYPRIFIAGWVNDVYGIWKSDDEGASWTQIGRYPLGKFDRVGAIEGSKVDDTVYIGMRGSGYVYGTPN